MPRTTDPQARLRQQLAALATEQAALEAKARQVRSQLETFAREERRRLQAQVGKLADEAGLLAYDLGTIEKTFARLAEALAQPPTGETE